MKVLGTFLAHFKKKQPVMVEQEWFFHWDNAPVHTAAVVKDWLAAHRFNMIGNPPYLPDLAPADFLFRKVKEGLAGLTLDQESLKKTWEGVTRTITAEDFQGWYERCKKCVRMGGKFVGKNKHLSTYNRCSFSPTVQFESYVKHLVQ